MGAYSGVGAYLSSSGSEVGAYSEGGLIREWGHNRSITVLELIGLLSIVQIMKLFILIHLILNIFQKKPKYLLVVKAFKQIYSDYKHMIQLCVVIFAVNLLTLCLKISL